MLELIGKLGLDGSGFEAGMKKAEHTAERLGDSLKEMALAAFGFYGVEQAIHHTVENAKELVVASQRLGIGVEHLQVLRHAAEESNVELAAMEKAFEKINIAREAALSGSEEGMKKMARFKELGITYNDLRNKTAEQLFTGQMASQAKTRNQEDLGPILKEILGKGFGELMPVLKTDFEELEKKMRHMGLIISAETAVKLKAMGDEFEFLGKIIVSSLGPAIVKFVEWMMSVLSKSKVIEGLDYLIRSKSDKSKLPEFVDSRGFHYSAEKRRDAAVDNIEFVRKAIDQKMPFEKFKAAMTDVHNSGIFEDFTGTSYKDVSKYFGKLINPVANVENQSATAAGNDMSGFQRMLAELQEEMKRKAEELNHPVAPHYDPTSAPVKATNRNTKDTDSLLRVGNFLGSAKTSTIERIGHRTNELLTSINGHLGRMSRLTGSDTSFPAT